MASAIYIGTLGCEQSFQGSMFHKIGHRAGDFEASGNLLVIRDTYLIMVGSGDCRRRIKTWKNSGDRRYCLHDAWMHILPREKRAILRGDSLLASLLPGANAVVEWSEMTFSNACIAPLDIMSSHSLLEFRTRLLKAPAALALVLSSSSPSKRSVRCGMD